VPAVDERYKQFFPRPEFGIVFTEKSEIILNRHLHVVGLLAGDLKSLLHVGIDCF
jgi:hypothetical protein